MERRTFLNGPLYLASMVLAARPGWASTANSIGIKLAEAAKAQIGVTRGYDPAYRRIDYPGGDVPRETGVCADVVVRAGRDALGLDLQKLVHEDMLRDFAAYPTVWHRKHPDSNIDHRRVLNLETYWRSNKCAVWLAPPHTAGNDFPGPLLPGDLLTWLLDARLPHVGVVVGHELFGTQIVHNIGSGVQQNALIAFRGHRAGGHYRWPAAV
jgi:uncharacterized protein YijF (DUF1287 family)